MPGADALAPYISAIDQDRSIDTPPLEHAPLGSRGIRPFSVWRLSFVPPPSPLQTRAGCARIQCKPRDTCTRGARRASSRRTR